MHNYVFQVHILGIAVDKMASDQSLWKDYFSDFIRHKLELVGPDSSAEENIAQQVWCTYFQELHNTEMPRRLIELHCYASIYHVSLARMATILHPLSKIDRVRKKINGDEIHDLLLKSFFC